MFPSIRYRQTDMLVHPQFDPVVFTLGPLSVRWYGVMYLLGFAAFWCLGRLRAKEAWRGITPEDVEDLLFYGVFGVVLGGRLGYCLFYQPGYYLSHPGEIFALWHGGMSAHGGLLGVIFVMILFAWRKKKSLFTVSDFVAPLVPLGLMAGRIGNFINGELWGRPASPDLPWAMVFPQAADGIARHPSQLYEALGEGLILFLMLRIGTLLPWVRCGALHRRIFPRTRRLFGTSGAFPLAGTVAYDSRHFVGRVFGWESTLNVSLRHQSGFLH